MPDNRNMTRASQLNHPPQATASPTPASTVLWVRDGPQGLEVLMTRRSESARFAPGAYVFPGGVIDAADADANTHANAPQRAGQSLADMTDALAGIRESFEEMGILLARRPDASWATQADCAKIKRTSDDSRLFYQACASLGLTPATDQLHTLARWTTDRDWPRRFDVAFLVACMPAGQTAIADEKEQFEPIWIRPTDALNRWAAGTFFIIYPTIKTLERIQGFATAQLLINECRAHEEPLWQSCPRGAYLQGKDVRFMEHESAFGELALTCPDGQMLHHLDWQFEQPVALQKNVLRLTAPNPGFMTGPGTNSYLVGDPHTGFIAIDPGPADAAHIDRLWRAAGGHITAIICTHSHPDHSPGAQPLQALCNPPPPILGLTSGPHARANSQFTPDRTLADGERLTLAAPGHDSHTLRVIHTPGHASNHICLVLEEDGLLFSGDHVLNGSTTVIDPPDGNMDDYLRALDTLIAACESDSDSDSDSDKENNKKKTKRADIIDFILPAHGYVIGFAKQAIAQLKTHRLQREAKIRAAMQALPQGSVDDWVAHAYRDVPERLWPVAKRSLLAHVARIQALA